jgi:hypothetical protein
MSRQGRRLMFGTVSPETPATVRPHASRVAHTPVGYPPGIPQDYPLERLEDQQVDIVEAADRRAQVVSAVGCLLAMLVAMAVLWGAQAMEVWGRLLEEASLAGWVASVVLGGTLAVVLILVGVHLYRRP